MTVIDGALQNYWTAFDQLQGFDKPALALVEVLQACNSWLKRKLNQPAPRLSFFSGGRKDLEKRKAAVIGLANNSMTMLDQFIKDGLIGGDTRELRARRNYERHRFLFLGRSQLGSPGKALDPAYANERESWVNSGKQSNVSGSVVHWTHETLKDGQDPSLKPGWKLRKILKKDVNTLGIADWLDLKKFCLANGMGQHTDKSTQCRYLAREERMLGMVFFNAQGLAENYDGAVLDFWSGGDHQPIYAMDRYGNLYTDRGPGIKWQGKSINHSSMLSGNDVICAGNLAVTQGQITAINNNSGHYKPTKENLAQCVRMLQYEGADLTRTQVIVKTFAGNQCWDLTWNSVAAFLTLGQAPDSSVQRH